MKNTILLFLLLFSSSRTAFSQSYWIPKTPLLDTLFNLEGDISDISNMKVMQTYLPIRIKKSNTSQVLIKNKTGLYILVEGTGQVYQATNKTSVALQFTRIDSTVYFGYNFHAINFSYKDSLFSYGGIGFWLINGHLRYFSNGQEWNIIELPNVYPTVKTLYNYLPNKSKLFFVQDIIAYKKLGNYSYDSDYSLIEINLANKNNKILGELNKSLAKKIHAPFSYSFNVEFLDGTILHSGDSFYLLRFVDNTVYKLVSKDIINKLNGSSNDGISNIFEKNGLIYYYNRFDSSIKRIPISLSDFQKEPYTLYKPFKNNTLIYYSIAGLILVSIGIYFLHKKIYNKKSLSQLQTDSFESSMVNSMEFNTIESTLIDQIITKANKKEFFTVAEMNNTLGLNKKSLEIQKKIRTETINRINHKFKVKYNKEGALIERIRSEEDRRYYLYTISKENANLISNKS